jgi:hypothetical protein
MPLNDAAVQRFHDAILEILHENSGGIKGLVLYGQLSALFAKDEEINMLALLESDELDQLVSSVPNVTVIQYDWDMERKSGKGQIREKTFVCTQYQEEG